MNSQQLVKIFNEIYNNISKEKDILNDLDQKIGDGDHGTNVERGFKSVIDNIDSKMTPKEIFKKAAMELMSKIGGSSGPLLGSLALQISNSLNDGEEVSLTEISKGFENGISSIKMLGKSDLNDKTMLDSLIPAVEVLSNVSSDSKKALIEAAEAAEKGMLNTKEMEAKKGRAAYLGERSVGHIDPGSKTISIIFNSIVEVIK